MMKTRQLNALLGRGLTHIRPCQSFQSTQQAQQPSPADIPGSQHNFRTFENNPLNHSQDHLGQFYTVPPNEKSTIFLYGGLPKTFEIQTKTFQETCLMVRKPSLDIINCLKAIDYTKPCVRFVMYGKAGCGKSLALAHVLHYAHKAGFLLVHVPWVGQWMRQCKESSNSETKEGFTDLNIDAAAWLIHFKSQNEHLLSTNADLKMTQDQVWNKRETTLKDAPLIELLDHGINRIKYASDCIGVLARELKELSKSGACRCLVAIDGFNAFFYPKTRVFGERKVVIPPNKITVTEPFLQLTKFDWNNSAIVVTVDYIAVGKEDHKSELPRYLLGKEGFEHLDPFVPIRVSEYSPKELTSCLNYYRERKWLLPVEGQDEELAFLSASNPYRLMQLCASL